jgi:outer membrane protein
MKRSIVLVVLFLFAASGLAYAQEMKVGVVDLMRALNESDAGKKAKSDLETMIKAKQVTIDEKGKTIEKLKAEVEKQASVLSADAKKTKEEELEKMVRDYQRMVSDAQNEIKKKEGEYTGNILKEIRDIIETIGKNEGYTLIVENAEGLILFSKQDMDLTNTVIAKYNESKAGKK